MNRIYPIILILIVFFLSSVPPCHGDQFTSMRQEMVTYDIKARGVKDPSVLHAMRKVQRHLLVPKAYSSFAYADTPLPIGKGQTISQPFVVALMTEALGLRPTDRVLEIGTGSGYQAAVLAEIVFEVYSIEIIEGLAKKAKQKLRDLGYRNINLKVGDGYYGWKEHAPFDAIIITASANHIPPPLIKQLKTGGKLIIPLGPTVFSQMLTMATKREDGKVEIKLLGGVKFVPMTGKARED